jgi:hypothetical protein
MLAVFLMAFFKIKEGVENMGASPPVASAVALDTISDFCKQNPDDSTCKKNTSTTTTTTTSTPPTMGN